MVELEFRRTGDFWIDMGIISIWNYFALGSYKVSDSSRVATISREPAYDDETLGTVSLSHSSLKLNFHNDEIAEKEFAKMLDWLRSKYIGKVSTGREWWIGLSRFFYKNQSNPDPFFVSPKDMKERDSKWKSGSCDICGDDDLVKPVGATEHPLVVVPSKFSSFYSHLKGDVKICTNCTFASKFSPLKLFFARVGNTLNFFAIVSDDLTKLADSFRDFSSLFAEAQMHTEYSNFPRSLYNLQYPLENCVSFLIATRDALEKKKDVKLESPFAGDKISRIHVLQATLGQGLIIDRHYVIPNVPRIFDLVSSCYWKGRSGQKHNALLGVLDRLYLKKGSDKDTTIREEFCRRILYEKDCTNILEEFLITQAFDNIVPISKFDTINFNTFLNIYLSSILEMDSSQLYASKQVGEMIGNLVVKTENKGLLYELRSVANLDKFLEFLHRTLTRYMEEIDPNTKSVSDLLRSIELTNWRIYKSLIGIYSVLAYISTIKQSQPEEPEKPEIKANVA